MDVPNRISIDHLHASNVLVHITLPPAKKARDTSVKCECVTVFTKPTIWMSILLQPTQVKQPKQ